MVAERQVVGHDVVEPGLGAVLADHGAAQAGGAATPGDDGCPVLQVGGRAPDQLAHPAPRSRRSSAAARRRRRGSPAGCPTRRCVPSPWSRVCLGSGHGSIGRSGWRRSCSSSTPAPAPPPPTHRGCCDASGAAPTRSSPSCSGTRSRRRPSRPPTSPRSGRCCASCAGRPPASQRPRAWRWRRAARCRRPLEPDLLVTDDPRYRAMRRDLRRGGPQRRHLRPPRARRRHLRRGGRGRGRPDRAVAAGGARGQRQLAVRARPGLAARVVARAAVVALAERRPDGAVRLGGRLPRVHRGAHRHRRRPRRRDALPRRPARRAVRHRGGAGGRRHHRPRRRRPRGRPGAGPRGDRRGRVARRCAADAAPRPSCCAPPAGAPPATAWPRASCTRPPGRSSRRPTSSPALVDHVRPALETYGDLDLVEDGLRRVLAGTGASRQRAAFERTGSVEGVVDDLVARTRGSSA